MKKSCTKSIAALAMATVMGVGGLGMAKLFQKTAIASADTGIVSVADSAIGLGEANKATVNVSYGNPAILTLNNVPANQYMLVAKVIEATGNYFWIDLLATANYNTVYLAENAYLNAFIGTVTVDGNSTIELSTYSNANLTVEVWLQPLAIGQFNDYYLGDIQISATTSRTIALDGVSGSYMVVVETYDSMAPDAVIKVNGTALTKNPDMYGAWTGTFDLSNVSSIELSTTNTEEISVYLTLREDVKVNEELPMYEYAEFSLYESKTFYYQAEDDGYFAFSYTSNVENAEFSLLVKTNPNNFDGIAVQGENYPLYMEAGEYYYVTVTYTGIYWELGESPETAEAIFAVEEWIKPTLKLNEESVYVPVAAEDKAVAVPMTVAAGTYDLNLLNIPFDVLFGGYTVTAHFGTKEVELDYGYAQIEVTNETSIWFTTDYPAGFVAGVTLNAPEVIENIELNEWTDISVPAGESRLYYLENVAEGYFNVTLNGTAAITVESSTYSYPVISAGQTFGTFFVATYGEEVATVALYFYNNSLETANFKAIVEPTGNVAIELGANDIQLAAGQTKVYYLENLAEGLYEIALSNADIEVMANGMLVTDGKFIANYDGESVALRFTNTGDATVNFTATITLIANGVITVDEEAYLFMDPSSNVKTYLVEGLEAGTYTIKLSDYVTDVTVMMGNTTVIAAGETTGTFTVAAGESVILTISYSGADFLYFSVLVEAEEVE